MASKFDGNGPPTMKVPKLENGQPTASSSSSSSTSSSTTSSTKIPVPKRKQAKESRARQEEVARTDNTTNGFGSRNRRRGGRRESTESSTRLANRSSRDDGHDGDDSSMDELLSDLRPLRQRGTGRRSQPSSSRPRSGGSSTTRLRVGNTMESSSSTAVSVVSSGVNTDLSVIVDDIGNRNGNFTISVDTTMPNSGGIVSVALIRAHLDARRARTAQLQQTTAIQESTGTTSRIRALFPHLPAADRVMENTTAQNEREVITLSDSDDESDANPPGNTESRPVDDSISFDEPDPVILPNRSTRASNGASNANQLANDEAYARRLQAQLDYEYNEYRARRRSRRNQRLRALRNLFVDVDMGESTPNSGPTEEPPRIPTPPDLPAIEIVGSSTLRIGSNNFPPFHRRPRIPATESASAHSQTTNQTGVGPNQAQSTATGESGTSTRRASSSNTLFTGERELLTLVDLMRMRRVWLQRAMRYGDFGPLDAALMDLAQTLGEALTDDEINRLPTSVVSWSTASTSSSSTMNTTCTICMEEFVDDEVQRNLPCSHTFHKGCIDVWLKQKSTCPICRVDARGTNRQP